MNTKLLKQKILDLAIRGKLVPQDPNDEPASVLLGRIKAEKERLIAEGKIKRSKKSAQTSDKPHYENVPFEVLAGWEWCIVDDLAYVASGSTPDKSAFVPDGIPYIKMYNLKKQKIDFESHPQYIKDKVHNGKLQRSRTEVGDLIMNIVGPPLGKLAIIPPSLPQSNFNQAAVLIRPYLHKSILVKYLFYYLSEMSEINSISTKGSAGQVNISLTQSQNMRIALPPIQEQQRIVSELDKYFAIVDNLEGNKDELVEIIKLTKNKILDLAIRGKLVPQDPTDEPASELLKRINPDAKPCDTSHYENLPKGWAITSMQNVCQLADGEKQEGIERINLDVKFLRGKGEGELTIKGKYVPADSTMILVDGENSGEIFNTPIEGYQGSTFKLLNINSQIYKPFVLYVIKSHQRNLRENKVGSAIPHLNKKTFREIVVFIPPFAEQKRIVEKVQNIIVSLDNIAAEL